MATAPNFTDCTSLKFVDMSFCGAMTTAPNLTGCTSILVVKMEGCIAMTTVPNFIFCTSLRHVDMQNCTTLGVDKIYRGSYQGIIRALAQYIPLVFPLTINDLQAEARMARPQEDIIDILDGLGAIWTKWDLVDKTTVLEMDLEPLAEKLFANEARAFIDQLTVTTERRENFRKYMPEVATYLAYKAISSIPSENLAETLESHAIGGMMVELTCPTCQEEHARPYTHSGCYAGTKACIGRNLCDACWARQSQQCFGCRGQRAH